MKKIIRNIIILVILMLVVNSSGSLFAKRNKDATEIIVCKNETIWSIATTLASDNNQNIQNVVYDIKKINNMNDSVIYEGQTLLIPIYK